MAGSIKIISRVKPYIKVITKSALRKWGYIFGNIEDQEDLVTYIDDKISGIGAGSGIVVSIQGTSGRITVDATDTANPKVDISGTFDSSITTAILTTVNNILVDYATNAYAESLVVGLWDDRGNYDASGNTFPAAGGSGTAGAILKGDIWTISVGGTLGGNVIAAGDTVRALVDTPGQTGSNWAIAENNIGYVPENASNKQTDLTPSATKYPTVNAVVAGLALKANLTSNLNRKIYGYANTNSSVTGTLTETILSPNTLFVEAGAMGANGVLDIAAYMQKTGTAGACTFKVYLNSSYSLEGAQQLHFSGSLWTATTKSGGFSARAVNKNSLTSQTGSLVSSYDFNAFSTNAAVALTNNFAVRQYVLLTATLANTGDTAILDNIQIYVNNP